MQGEAGEQSASYAQQDFKAPIINRDDYNE
jgi:hypothetical protein